MKKNGLYFLLFICGVLMVVLFFINDSYASTLDPDLQVMDYICDDEEGISGAVDVNDIGDWVWWQRFTNMQCISTNFDTQANALAYRSYLLANGHSMGAGYCGACPSGYGSSGEYNYYDGPNDMFYTKRVCFADPMTNYESYCAVDSDGDGLNDDIRTSTGIQTCYGENDPDEPITLVGAGFSYLPEDLNDFLGGENQPGGLAEDNQAIPDTEIDVSTTEYEDFEDGLGNTGNTTESDYLSDIVDNTKDALENQQKLGDYLIDLNNEQKKTNKILADQENTIQIDVPEGASAEEIADEIKADQDQDDIEGQVETDKALADIAAANDDFGEGFTEDDIPDENPISGVFGDFMANNPVSDYLSGTGIDTTQGNCSFTWDYKGSPVEFTICNFEPQVELMGAILLGLAGISSLLIVFKR